MCPYHASSNSIKRVLLWSNWQEQSTTIETPLRNHFLLHKFHHFTHGSTHFLFSTSHDNGFEYKNSIIFHWMHCVVRRVSFGKRTKWKCGKKHTKMKIENDDDNNNNNNECELERVVTCVTKLQKWKKRITSYERRIDYVTQQQVKFSWSFRIFVWADSKQDRQRVREQEGHKMNAVLTLSVELMWQLTAPRSNLELNEKCEARESEWKRNPLHCTTRIHLHG